MSAATFLCALSATAALRSEGGHLPLISRLQHEASNAQPLHSQAYGKGLLGRRRTTVLTHENTKRIRYQLNFDSLYVDTNTVSYTTCFEVGAWFRRGLPAQQTPPLSGNGDCLRTSPGDSLQANNEGCWGRCLATDVVTPEAADAMVATVEDIVFGSANFQDYFAVQPVQGNLTFAVAPSTYGTALQSKGYANVAGCAVDCKVLSGVSVPSSYCEGGVEADVVLSVTKPPGLAGIAGTGSSCAADQEGRPLMITFEWHKSVTELPSKSLAQNVEENAALTIHEILHGLGFSNSQFRYARNAQGELKHLIQLKPVEDPEDTVWFFVKGRAYELAQEYFGCPNSSWAAIGLPLMGQPEVGRGSHWSTRIMRDDVMSYGHSATVSGITLAAMEDLGFYVANYSAAQCMYWGYQQGCKFVSTRCGKGYEDSSAEVDDKNQCKGVPTWDNPPIEQLAQKCEYGNDPCSDSSRNGFRQVGSQKYCNAQCFYVADQPRSGCSAAPSSAIEGSGGIGGVYSRLLDQLMNWEVWIIPALLVLAPCLLLGPLQRLLCPRTKRCATIANVLSVVVGLVAAIICGFSCYGWANYGVLEAFVATSTVITFAIASFLIFLFACAAFAAVIKRWRKTLLAGFWLLMLLAVLEALMTIFLSYWVYTMDDVSANQINVISGTEVVSTGDNLIRDWLSGPLDVMEGIICKTYQLCCRDPTIDISIPATNVSAGFNATGFCYTAEDGELSDLSTAMQDPSSYHFCPYVTGAAQNLLITPPAGICQVIEALSSTGFNQAQCQARFCPDGTEAYLVFVNTAVKFMQEYALPFLGTITALVFVQLVWGYNMLNVRRLALTKPAEGSLRRASATFSDKQHKHAPVVSSI
mmetsp:Transcript_16384/g.27922  ORF Transcript_16384/g.27922 Transcript_16384/m.27922 type:complete len:866 (-) Transcript_16384:715-3312(-)